MDNALAFNVEQNSSEKIYPGNVSSVRFGIEHNAIARSGKAGAEKGTSTVSMI